MPERFAKNGKRAEPLSRGSAFSVSGSAPSTVFTREPGAESSQLGTEMIVLDSAGGTLRGMNLSAARIWEWLEAGCDVETVARALSRRYRLARGRVESDVRRFFGELLAGGLIRSAPVAALPGGGMLLLKGEEPYEPPGIVWEQPFVPLVSASGASACPGPPGSTPTC